MGQGNIKESIFNQKRNDDKHFTAFTYNLELFSEKRLRKQELNAINPL